MKYLQNVWVLALGFLLASTMVLEFSFYVARLISDVEPIQLLISAAVMIPLLFLVKARVAGFPNPRQASDLSLVESLKYSVPVMASWIPAVLGSAAATVLVPGWETYLVGNLLHSSIIEELMFRAVLFRLSSDSST